MLLVPPVSLICIICDKYSFWLVAQSAGEDNVETGDFLYKRRILFACILIFTQLLDKQDSISAGYVLLASQPYGFWCQLSCIISVGQEVLKWLEQLSSDDHQMSVVFTWGRVGIQVTCLGGILPCDLSNDLDTLTLCGQTHACGNMTLPKLNIESRTGRSDLSY